MNGKIPSAAKLVFDTNVLISAFVFRGKARIVYQYCVERYSVFTTEWLLDELQRVLSRPKFGLPVPVQYAILDQVRADAQLVYPFNELPTHSVDPDDNYVLQAALFVDANFLITGRYQASASAGTNREYSYGQSYRFLRSVCCLLAIGSPT